ncbi:MAG: moderate conductance mechanosensitive channel [Rhodospirillaceae bacterium]|nr:moderate conductance mechanosensitive channel [Rhodospirillaceae bacterium]
MNERAADASRCGSATRGRAGTLIWLTLVLLLLVGHAPPAHAVSPSPRASQSETLPANIRQFLDLLADPAVQRWLEQQRNTTKSAAPAPAPDRAMTPSGYLAYRVGAIRQHLGALLATVPQMPAEFAQARATFAAELQGHGLLEVLALLAIFLALGFGLEWLVRRTTAGLRQWIGELGLESVRGRVPAVLAQLVYEIALVSVFAIASVGAFLAFDWPPLLREIVLGYLGAFVVLRLALAIGRFLLAPGGVGYRGIERFRIVPVEEAAARHWYRHLAWLVGWFAFGWVTVDLCLRLGFSRPATQLVAYVLGLGLLAIGIQMVWRQPAPIAAPENAAAGQAPSRHKRHAHAWLLTGYFLLLWLLWVASAMPTFWLLVVLTAVWGGLVLARRSIDHLLRPADTGLSQAAVPSIYAIYLKRGLQAAFIIAGALFLASAWHIDLGALTSSDTMATRLLRGVLSSIVILLAADFGWQVAKTMIDRKVAAMPHSEHPDSAAARRHARMRTLLPIFRNVLFVVLLVMVVLMVLAALGIDIAPLVAGASVVGVAIGFGAQTLVRDVISGMFYLLDDAFRTGEYIQSGNYKGTVESFSLRSVKLRHHRGPLYTVPFGQLGAVQNMSRDWVIDKLSVGVTYDTDLDKVKKLVKQIGSQLAEDPELGPNIMEPLKMQGVEQFGDFAIQIRMKMMTRPGEQFMVRRRAFAMIKQAFDANGINFAFPTVQVAGGETAAAAASTYKALDRPAAS